MNRRQSLRLIIAGSLFASSAAKADFASDLLKQFGGLVNGNGNSSTSSAGSSGLSQAEMAQGIKEALSKGVRTAINQLGKPGGFLDDAKVRIPLPGFLQKIDDVLRSLHQEKLADEFIATMNHAAEKAVPQAAEVFASAIKQMTFKDVEGIVKGPDDAATAYFRRTSSAELTRRFRPIVEQATNKAGVTVAYKQMMGQAGPMAQMLVGNNTDLDGYITGKALDGLFLKVADEEKAIRAHPYARTTDLLKKVFGSK